MIKKMSSRMSNLFVLKGLIGENDYEVYAYGTELLLSTILNTMVSLLLGILFRQFIQSILFLIIYTNIKCRAGGYHAKHHWSCILGFNLIYFCILLNLKLFNVTSINVLILFGWAISWILNLLWAPLEDINKSLTSLEKANFKFKARIVFSVLSIFNLCLYILLGDISNKYLLFSTLALALTGIDLIAGRIKRYLYFKRINKNLYNDHQIV